MRILHVTHNDMDAVGCQIILALSHPNDEIDVRFCSIGSQDDIICNELNKNMEEAAENPDEYKPIEMIWVTDLSIKGSTMDAINTFIKESSVECVFQGVDHHISNTMNETEANFMVKTEEYFPGDNEIMPVSATYLMWKNFLYIPPHDALDRSWRFIRDLEFFALSVSRYDTWVWKKYPDIVSSQNEVYRVVYNTHGMEPEIFDDDFYTVICKKYGCYDLCNMILSNIKNHDLITREDASFLYQPEFKSVYALEKKIEKTNSEKAIKQVRFNVDREYIVGHYMPSGEYRNTVTEALYSNFPFVDYWKIYFPNDRSFGFRSNKEDVNVSRIAARLYHGGGHKSASGAKFVNTKDYLEEMTNFYSRSITADEMQEVLDTWGNDANMIYQGIREATNKKIISGSIDTLRDEENK